MSSETPTNSDELASLARQDPNATPERVADSVIRYAEKVLTEAFLAVTPPSPAPPVSAKLQALRLRRFPASRRNQTKKRLEKRDELLGNLYRLHSLNRHSVSRSNWATIRSLSSNSHILSWPTPDGVPYKRGPAFTSTVDFLEAPIPPVKLPYSGPIADARFTRVLSFEYDEQWRNRMRDTGLDEIAKTLERSAREFAEKSQSNWAFTLLEESDPEVPSWKRNVLRIFIDTADFDEKVRLWDQLDKQIRDRLAAAAGDYPDLRQQVEQFSESLFLKIDL